MNETENNDLASKADGTPVHASLSELIEIRDGEPNAYEAHVAGCSFCQARLEEVYTAAKTLQDTMLFAADLPVPDTAWLNIEKQLKDKLSSDAHASSSMVPRELMATQNKSPRPSFWSSINAAVYSLAAAIMFTGMVTLYTSQQSNQQARQDSLALQASIQSLMDNSRGLETVLQQVAVQNNAPPLSFADQSTVDRLQWRLMAVDQKIHESESGDDVDYEQIKALWNERIDALNEMNKVYYGNQVATTNERF
ncbi:MAG: hypothetical protein KTR16_07705 [Acidiferrobacterales bacterium]|nr:hypothetical protein [Acidiferrobacterales bacterium]